MGLLIALILLLILAIVFFITFPNFKRKIVSKKYNTFCGKKINAIASKNGLKSLSNLSLNFYNNTELKIDYILFGKKYFYILSNYCFDGDIKGLVENNSWIYKKRHDKGSEYIDNIFDQLSEKTALFSAKISANPSLILSIAIINNECQISIGGNTKNNAFIVHYSSLKKLIKKLEETDVAILDADQVQNIYENLRYENAKN